MAAVPVAALPTQSWNGYRWARSGPLEIKLGSNVTASWLPFLETAAAEWTAANNIDFVQIAGKSTASGCRGVYGTVQACSYNYGATGWIGYTNVYTSKGFIVQATVKLNEYYFGQAKYNSTAWRQYAVCHELGHSLGLDHANSNKNDLNNGSCLDYTNNPGGSTAGSANGTLNNMHAAPSDFSALDGIYAAPAGTQLVSTTPAARTGAGLSIIDGVDFEGAVTAVPEPATWAMLIAGFGAVGTSMRRRTARSLCA